MQKLSGLRTRARCLPLVLILQLGACAVEDSGGESVGGTRDSGGDAGGVTDANADSADALLDLSRADTFFPDSGGTVPLDGTYFVAVDTVALPGALLWFSMDLDVLDAAPGLAASFVIQPLRTDLDESQSPRPNARTPTGAPVMVESVPITSGQFSFSPDSLTIPGDANPITAGVELVVDLTLTGRVIDETTLCGTVSGTIVQPIELDIDGSTFAATRFEGADFTTIENPPSACPN